MLRFSTKLIYTLFSADLFIHCTLGVNFWGLPDMCKGFTAFYTDKAVCIAAESIEKVLTSLSDSNEKVDSRHPVIDMAEVDIEKYLPEAQPYILRAIQGNYTIYDTAVHPHTATKLHP